MDWFENLTGFREESPQQVRDNLVLDGEKMRSLVNNKTWNHGRLEMPSLGELRQRVQNEVVKSGKLSLREVVGNVQSLHTNPANTGALFQVASQFNLLEMVSPRRTPEEGVGIYSRDRTQGPACAVAAGAGTIYRNYFVPVNGQTGQSKANQVDCLADIGKAWGNSENPLWQMKNGYAIASQKGLTAISQRLETSSESERDRFRKLLRIGIQWQTQVTLQDVNIRYPRFIVRLYPSHILLYQQSFGHNSPDWF